MPIIRLIVTGVQMRGKKLWAIDPMVGWEVEQGLSLKNRDFNSSFIPQFIYSDC